MMSYIGCGPYISRLTDFFYHISFTLSSYQENNVTGIQYRITGHCDALLPVTGINTDYINRSGSQQFFLSGENGGSMTIVSCTQQYNIKLWPSLLGRYLLLDQLRITGRFFHRFDFTTNTKDILIRNGSHS